MNVFKDILRQYWSHLLAIAVFICAAVRFRQLGDYMNEDHFTPFALGIAGLAWVLIGYEWTATPSDNSERLIPDSDWVNRRSVTVESWDGPIIGGVMLVCATIWLYRL